MSSFTPKVTDLSLPEPPANGVVVGLRNPPSDATMWSLVLTDWNMTVLIDFVGRNGTDRLDIAEAAIFEIPDGLEFPLRIALLQLTKWNPEGTALIQLYSVQSIRELDPDYREAFIPDYGSYYYNVAEEGLVPPSVPSMLESMIPLMIVVMMMSMMMKMMEGAFKPAEP